MKIPEYKKLLKAEPINVVECFLVRDNRVLLGFKKRGFGIGRWFGIGGKIEEGESAREAAAREIQEEICVKVKNLRPRGTVFFYFSDVENPESWNQKSQVFVCPEWVGVPAETDEIKPQWFDLTELPFEEMFPDFKIWLPPILRGERVKGEFLFGRNFRIEDYRVSQVVK